MDENVIAPGEVGHRDTRYVLDELHAIRVAPNPYLPAPDLDNLIGEGWRDIGPVDSVRIQFEPPHAQPSLWMFDAHPPRTLTVEFIDVELDFMRALLGIPAGFPLWYRPVRPALEVGPLGRLIQRTQCGGCGHDETQHMLLLAECLGVGECACTGYQPRVPVPPRATLRARLQRRIAGGRRLRR